jgi:multidrug efflux system outer membrane protein
MKNTALLGILAVLLLEAGCMMGPKYKRPTVDVPQEYRAPAPQQADQASSLGNEQWWQVYQDPVLTQLIHTAITQNYDVRIAAARVLEAQAHVGITRSNQLPSASVGADVFSQQNAKVTKLFPAYQVNGGDLNLSVIWNLDFWGKYRRQTEAARAQLLATEWGQRAVLSSLVANVATAYFQLRALDIELEISKRTLASRQESLKLTQFLESHGSNSGLDVSQAEQLVYTASETIPDLERQIQQQENLLSVLLGENPESIPRGRTLTEQPVPQNVPAGLPSELLERRPDVRQAEEMMVAANAPIAHRTRRTGEQCLAPVHHRAIGDLVRGLQCQSTCLPRRGSSVSTQARSRQLAGSVALLPANGSERPGTSFQFTRRFSKRPRVPRATGTPHECGAADRSIVRGAL